MAWGRRARLIVGSTPRVRGAGMVMTETALDLSNLHFEFEVERSIAFEDGAAEVTIFNLSKSSRAAMQAGLSIIIDAGYADSGIGSIFVGEIRQVRHQHSTADWITKIKARSGRPVLQDLVETTTTLSYSAGASLNQVLEDVTAGLGILLAGKENSQGMTLPNGLYFAGRYQSLIARLKTELASRQVGLYIDFNQMVLYKAGEPGDYSVVVLDQTSGLLEAKVLKTALEMTELLNIKKRKVALKPSDIREKVVFTSILLPSIIPNSLVRIAGAEVSGIFLVERVKYTGDNYGKSWTIRAEATRSASR